MTITEQWLKKHGWEIHNYDIAYAKDIFHYAIRTFGTNKVYWNDKHQLTIFRDYSEGNDTYADVLIDNIDSVEKLMKAITLCGVGNFEEYEWLYENWLNKACEWLQGALPISFYSNGIWMLADNIIDGFRKAMMKEESK